jgi:hypothetical protein
MRVLRVLHMEEPDGPEAALIASQVVAQNCGTKRAMSGAPDLLASASRIGHSVRESRRKVVESRLPAD